MPSMQLLPRYHTRVRTTDPPPPPPPPPFPPPGVLLHPDDANSKVFHAVARAFVAVDNRAMTIKDIADRASRHGLVCQNLSAAAQAVTTYLRAHKARCDRQQDQPLLLSHSLSGTPADDDLVPALFSRSGGDSALPSDGRLTNFRKGTAVWYLSRATGIPCPFTRAGIRLCDYVHEDDHDKGLPRRELRDLSVGLKRKRPLRGCVLRNSDNDDSDQPPPKVKLTLRLKPLLPKATPVEGSSPARPIDVSGSDVADQDDRSDDSMPVDSSDEQDSTDDEPAAAAATIDNYTQQQPSSSAWATRSPSLPFATPPPDSDDEADDYYAAMAHTQNYDNDDDDDDMGWDADLDSEGEDEEGETVWESPGPRSPSAPLVYPAEIAVKEEPRDVQGMLDAWEDFDNVAVELTKAQETGPQIKLEPLDSWGWNVNPEDSTHIKQEDLDFGIDLLFPPGPSTSHHHPGSEPDDDSARDYSTVRPRSKTVPASSSSFPVSPPRPPSTREVSVAPTIDTLLENLSVAPPTPCVSPLQTRCQPTFPLTRPVVVTTCQPCKPAISATQIEGISVYQMMLGAFQLLRRIDTGFVNLAPILAIVGAALSEVPVYGMLVSKGSPEICGTWVPLATAQAYVHSHSAHLTGKGFREALLVFLSDTLVELFPPALQDFHRQTPRDLNNFGIYFTSMHEAAKLDAEMEGSMGVSMRAGGSSLSVSSGRSTPGSLMAASSSSSPDSSFGLDDPPPPLSATEQQIFHELCVIPDWDREDGDGYDGGMGDVDMASPASPPPASLPPAPTSPLSVLSESPLSSPLSSPTITSARLIPTPAPVPTMMVGRRRTESTETQKPLRRSKRVADAQLAQPAAVTRAASARTRGRVRNSVS